MPTRKLGQIDGSAGPQYVVANSRDKRQPWTGGYKPETKYRLSWVISKTMFRPGIAIWSSVAGEYSGRSPLFNPDPGMRNIVTAVQLV